MNLQDIDDDLRADLMGGFENSFDEIEAGLSKLEFDFNPQLLNELFRSIHSIKGNAAMVHIDIIVDYTHEVENVFSRLRDGQLRYCAKLSEAIHVGMDRLRDLHHQQIMGVHFEFLDIEALKAKFSALAQASEDQVESCLNDILDIDGDTSGEEPNEHTTEVCLDDKQEADLKFFQELSLQLDKLSDYWQGRSIQSFMLAHRLNQVGGNPVSYEQLSAAIYLHDFGMSFVPTHIIENEYQLKHEERNQISHHPSWGHQLLTRIDGWQEAATIVLQHHEYVDGQGYPNGLTGESIHDGAKILAIIDAFLSMTNGRADRLSRRGALRAVSEINARKGTQFDTLWVERFNELLKQEIREGRL